MYVAKKDPKSQQYAYAPHLRDAQLARQQNPGSGSGYLRPIAVADTKGYEAHIHRILANRLFHPL